MDDAFFWLMAMGFAAQLVDGALGMAYGITATSLLLSFGYSPAMASATVHAAEVATSGVSGLSHQLAGNVDRKLTYRLAVAGAAGGVLGAYLLASGVGDILRPLVSGYLAIMGLLIIAKALKAVRPPKPLRRLGLLGICGGFFDAVGGGGWGPIVSSTLVLSGNAPARMIGSSVAAEFFMTIAVTLTFAAHLDLKAFGTAALALVLGGLPAAPLAAWLVRIVPRKPLMLFVGALVAGLGALGVWPLLVAL